MNAALWGLILSLAAVPILVLVNGFFVAAEFSLVAVRRTKLQEMVEAGRTGAQAAQQATENLTNALAACQLGITLASLALGWIGEPALAHLIKPVFYFFPDEWQDVAAHYIAFPVALALITFLHMVIGEQVPKVAALQIPDSMSLLLAGPLLVFERITRPALTVMNAVGAWVLHRCGMQPRSLEQMVHSVEELGLLIEQTKEAGVLSPDQAQFVRNVFEFTSKTVSEAMVPLDRMANLELHTPPDKVLEAVRESAHTRLPVYDGQPDNIVGIVNTKDLFHLFSLHGLVVLEDALYPAPFVRPEDSVATVLRRLKRLKRHMAVVRDDAGKVHGLITLEDVLEEIVGEIEDEHDQMA
jgi:CBS domain containing-hemolysin-like protein